MTDLYDAENDGTPDEEWDGSFGGPQTDIEDNSLHPAVLSDIKRVRVKSKYPDSVGDGKAYALRWVFALSDKGGYEVDTISWMASGKNSAMRRILNGLVGSARAEEIAKRPMNRQALIGTPCRILVTINANGYPDVDNILPPETPQEPRRAEESTGVVQDVAPGDPGPQEPSDGLGF